MQAVCQFSQGICMLVVRFVSGDEPAQDFLLRRRGHAPGRQLEQCAQVQRDSHKLAYPGGTPCFLKEAFACRATRSVGKLELFRVAHRLKVDARTVDREIERLLACRDQQAEVGKLPLEFPKLCLRATTRGTIEFVPSIEQQKDTRLLCNGVELFFRERPKACALQDRFNQRHAACRPIPQRDDDRHCMTVFQRGFGKLEYRRRLAHPGFGNDYEVIECRDRLSQSRCANSLINGVYSKRPGNGVWGPCVGTAEVVQVLVCCGVQPNPQ